MVILYIFLAALFVINCIQLYKLSEKLEHIEDTLTDIDIIYTKLQQFFRNH